MIKLFRLQRIAIIGFLIRVCSSIRARIMVAIVVWDFIQD